jgi:iron-sulfur cluster assembly accessory protein
MQVLRAPRRVAAPLARAVGYNRCVAATARLAAPAHAGMSGVHRGLSVGLSSGSSATSAAPPPPLPPRTQQGDSLQLDDLIVTTKAARRILSVRAKHVEDGKLGPGSPFSLRVRVDGGGCSGFKYEFAFEFAAPGAEDLVFGRDGAVVVTDATSLDLLRGSTLEWDDSMMRSAFAVANNPNAESSCGCKSSFAPKAKD